LAHFVSMVLLCREGGEEGERKRERERQKETEKETARVCEDSDT
jgi:hypothetical protein